MNDNQRKFLTERVNQTHKRQEEQLRKDIPIKPSLNNYLVAACLDGSLQLQDVEGLRNKIRESVLKYGKDDRLVEEDSEDDYRYRNTTKPKNSVTLRAEDIFVIPEAYLKALKEYQEKKKEIDDKIKILDSQKDTIILKIQIGSNKVLDRLVEQADNLVDLSIVNSQLLLTN